MIDERLDTGNTRFRAIELDLNELKMEKKLDASAEKIRKENLDMVKRPIYASIILGAGALVVYVMTQFFKDSNGG